jgi:hypothetical protein
MCSLPGLCFSPPFQVFYTDCTLESNEILPLAFQMRLRPTLTTKIISLMTDLCHSESSWKILGQRQKRRKVREIPLRRHQNKTVWSSFLWGKKI